LLRPFSKSYYTMNSSPWCRGVTRLDSAGGKKQVCRPRVRS